SSRRSARGRDRRRLTGGRDRRRGPRCARPLRRHAPRRVGLQTAPPGKPGSVSETTVLIDARNVQRSKWPNLRDEELVERAHAWAERNGKRIVLVFDGKAPGGVVDTTEPDERTM